MNAQTPVIPRSIAIVGGGLSGLVAAFKMKQLAKSSGINPEITLYETASKIGGVFGSVRRDGYLLETGADMFITNKPEGINLVRELGLESRLLNTTVEYRGSLILHRGKPVPTPEGLELMLPRKFWPFLTTPLLSFKGKLRGLAEYFIPSRVKRGEELKDETLSSFVKRRLGNEIFENIVQPMVGGIYTADPDKLSLLATMPRFLEWERDSGSLIAESLKQRSSDSGAMNKQGASGARYGLFVSFINGMSELQDALFQQSQPEVEFRLAEKVESIFKEDDGYKLVTKEQSRKYDAVLLALPVHAASTLVKTISPELSKALGSIEHASAAILVSGHKFSDFTHPLRSYGLVIPAKENRRIMAVSMTSRKFAGRAPEGCIQLRTFMGGALQQEMLNLSDDELTKIALEELRDIFGMKTEPHLTHLQRWNNAMPQYHLGHKEKVQSIMQEAARLKNFSLTSNALEGVGIPDVIASAEHAVHRLCAMQ